MKNNTQLILALAASLICYPTYILFIGFLTAAKINEVIHENVYKNKRV